MKKGEKKVLFSINDGIDSVLIEKAVEETLVAALALFSAEATITGGIVELQASFPTRFTTLTAPVVLSLFILLTKDPTEDPLEGI